MSIKRFTIVFALLALLTAAVSAHDDTESDGSKPVKRHGLLVSLENELLLEATGLDAVALRAALAEGTTIADLIAANDGDVDSVIADIAAQMADKINADMTAYLENLDEWVSEALNADHSRRGPWGRRWLRRPTIFMHAGVSDIILDATGLDTAGLRAALVEGATLAALIEANEGDVADVAAEVLATITDEVNAAAAERIEALPERLGELFDEDWSKRRRRGRQGRMRPRFYFGFWGVTGEPTVEKPAA